MTPLTHSQLLSEKDNPFYHNYLFSEKDLKRYIIKWWQYPLLFLFCRTYVQVSEGYAWFYKTHGGAIYFIKSEKLHD